MNVHRVLPSPCVNCGKLQDAATNIDANNDTAPEPGAIGICFYCCHLMVYGDDLQLRNPTDAEVVEMAGVPEIVAAMNMLGTFKAKSGVS